MSLPKIHSPIYILQIPSTGQKVKYTAFLVFHEKILAQAIQTGTQEAIIETIKHIISTCILDKIDVNKLSSFDIEYIFLQLRAKSKGHLVELKYVCKNDVEGIPCNHENDFTIDLEKITVDMSKAPDTKIMLTDTVGLVLKFPTLDNVVDIQMALAKNDAASIYSKIGNFVECVFEGDTVENNFTNEEFSKWLESLDTKQFKKIEKFFKNIPVVQSTSHVCCKKCGDKEDIVLEGLSSFLG